MNERWIDVLEGPCRFVAGLILFAYQSTKRLRERFDRPQGNAKPPLTTS